MNTKLTERQLRILVTLFIVGNSILFAPMILASEAKQDAWIASLIGIAIGCLIGLIYLYLYQMYPNHSLVEILEEVFGKWVGKIIGFSFFLFSFLLASIVLRNLGEFIVTEILPETPIQFVLYLILLVVIMGGRYGIHVIGRSAEILFIFFFFLYILFVLFLTPQFHLENIQPMFEEGIKPIFRASLVYIGFPFLESVVFLMIFQDVQNVQKIGRSFLMGIIIGGLMISFITFLSILVFSADFTARNIYASYILGKKISIGNFIERIEAVMAIIWMITIFLKLSILYYVSVKSFKQIFQFNQYRFLIFPFGIIMIVVALIVYPNIAYIYLFTLRIWFFYVASFGLLLPLILIIGIKLKKARWKKGHSNKGYSNNKTE
ncbi:GerAB/ArcD/ProY family transporter [Fervidibacillus albus]|uniref:Spore germination protein n=1 Tax=Fervidibacillus albus TaxID=2980026 RepID=A0A9E8LT11_9BACI|nr:endospore germination permease [Fervidibacillus albus]WAA09068.1 spore germination protein [Fervidibacillus albus]